jgi:hypothetical protein
MKQPRIAAAIAALLLLAGCATIQRGDCGLMLDDARAHCMQANASSERMVAERKKAQYAAPKPDGEFDKDDLEARRGE